MSLADDLRGTSEWLAAGNRVSVEYAQLLAHRDQQAADRIEALEAALRDIGDTPYFAMRGLMAKRALRGEPLLVWSEGAVLPE